MSIVPPDSFTQYTRVTYLIKDPVGALVVPSPHRVSGLVITICAQVQTIPKDAKVVGLERERDWILNIRHAVQVEAVKFAVFDGGKRQNTAFDMSTFTASVELGVGLSNVTDPLKSSLESPGRSRSQLEVVVFARVECAPLVGIVCLRQACQSGRIGGEAHDGSPVRREAFRWGIIVGGVATRRTGSAVPSKSFPIAKFSRALRGCKIRLSEGQGECLQVGWSSACRPVVHCNLHRCRQLQQWAEEGSYPTDPLRTRSTVR